MALELTPSFAVVDPRFRKLALPYIHVEKLYTGCRWAEGPAWFAAGRYLVWSDIPNDRMMRWDETDGSVSVFRQPALNSNGHTVDLQGRLVSCEHRGRCVSRTEHDGTRTVLASHFEGKRFNSPNDVVVKSDGSIWFTDPSYGIDSDYEGDASPSEIGAQRVYRIDPDSGAVGVVASDFVQPNGLAFSPDESLLYIVDTGATHQADGPHHVRRFRVAANGSLCGRRGLRHLPGRPLRRPARRRARQPVAERRRRRALPRPRRRAARQGADPGIGRQPVLRRRQAQPDVHLRHDVALRGLSQHPRRPLTRPVLRASSQPALGRVGVRDPRGGGATLPAPPKRPAAFAANEWTSPPSSSSA